ncbi:MAG: universal stress protein [Bdellovibrionales bacterium]|nr:universal stress protein [Bdellovibrionales bacterium]
MIFSEILVTTDFSPAAKVAYDLATYQAKAVGADLTLVSVFPPFELPAVLQRQINDPESLQRLKEEYDLEMNKRVAELAKEAFHRQDVKAVALFDSSPAKAITHYAKENGVSLIVIASHGRGSLKTLFLGTTTQKVIQSAECPVLVIPSLEDETA